MNKLTILMLMFTCLGLISSCEKSTPPQTATKKLAPEPLLVADPHWIPDPGNIELAKTAYLADCPKHPVEQQVNGYFGAPRWETGADSNGQDFVNISGTVTYRGQPSTALLQFAIDKSRQSLGYRAFAINGVLQPYYVATMTLKEMCASASQAPLEVTPLPAGVTH